ncbi:MAG TPA: DUF192 domain-containing protein [Caulobacteraceae bacterium]|nr:DUF192 domain-containing protein [Caulobacteraceae bacterium]
MNPFLRAASRPAPLLAAAFVAALAVAPAASARSRPPIPAPSRCAVGQPTLRLEPLDIVTARGVQHFRVEMADTDDSRETGLMCRTSVPANGGMLFDFGTPQPVSFWMKNTLVPLDMLFIGADGRIINIARNTRPLDETPAPSGGPALAVLELRGGRAAELGIAPGDLVRQRIFRR